MLFCVNQFRHAVGFPYVKGVVIVGVIGSDEIVFSKPVRDTGVGAVESDRKWKMLLPYGSLNPILSIHAKIHAR